MSTPLGEFVATIVRIAISISAERPAVITTLAFGDTPTTKTTVSHVVRLNNPDSLRIGFDELRSAFPVELAHLDDEELLTFLIEKTSVFTDRSVNIGIEQQLKNGIVQKDANGRPYYNVRLRSAVHNMAHDKANSLAKRLLAGVASAKAVNDAFSSADEPAH